MNAKAVLLVTVSVVALGYGGYSLKNLLSASGAANQSANRWFFCAETKKPFQLKIVDGMSVPVLSPFTGKSTGYPAETCYWTKEGTIKTDPTYVMLNTWLGDTSPTFCPDCGRLVVGHNPHPNPGAKAPPTKTEWEAKRGAGAPDRGR